MLFCNSEFHADAIFRQTLLSLSEDHVSVKLRVTEKHVLSLISYNIVSHSAIQRIEHFRNSVDKLSN